jgi:uncharacterized membrane protein YedE/YeeE
MSKRVVNLTANPLLAALGALFLGMGHWLVNHQPSKMFVFGVLTLLGTVACVLPGVIVLGLSVLEAYRSAARLTTGQTLHPRGYTVWFAYRLATLIDKAAVYEPSPTPIL